ncbi:MAG: hypothetical protein E5Y06_24115 [Mesorhizobium sp.]|uniref:hypothetical protein n=1 Tax=Mesorhizobium sp. TaxID=1871066 RepID=UPI0012292BE2|nr:hypothetical protein [Mesorhizobium sp.]TIN92200.1 MAG: hypothetical protein E5Y06_24115 [Mesorhizobium sp.]TJU96218.1 MAG: hypothetical protein E5Y08_22560 [Mesorhizobium sp.]
MDLERSLLPDIPSSVGLEKNTRVDNTPRIMWILNHTAARKFEIPILRELGYEVFTPKIYPNDANFRSASVDYSEDANLTIPADELAILNNSDWYAGPHRKAWEIANKYFDMAFFILFDPMGVETMCRRFNGELLWRTYGLAGKNTYSNILESIPQYRRAQAAFRRLGSRFWFAEGYSNLHEIESSWIQRQTVYLPLGMPGASTPSQTEWIGGDKRMLFVCPDIGFNPAYAEIYGVFKKEFKGFPYAIGGAQSIEVADPHILGYLPVEEHRRNMQHMQVMFYHSREPRHIHYHPFEAVKAGMPLVFMAGGMLDRMGGLALPGRAKSWEEARKKVRRLLDGDKAFVDKVRATQVVLLEGMKADNARACWAESLRKVEFASSNRERQHRTRAPRVAVLSSHRNMPEALRISRELISQSKAIDKNLTVILGVEDPTLRLNRKLKKKAAKAAVAAFTQEMDTVDVPARVFEWKQVSKAAAERALAYAGVGRALYNSVFLVPDDEINFFEDSDLWILVGGRMSVPVLPIKPIVVVVRDYPKAHIGSPNNADIWQARLGIIPEPEAVIACNERAMLHLINMEGLDPTTVHLVKDDISSPNLLLEAVLECL